MILSSKLPALIRSVSLYNQRLVQDLPGFVQDKGKHDYCENNLVGLAVVCVQLNENTICFLNS
jgi:hypothetical protein